MRKTFYWHALLFLGCEQNIEMTHNLFEILVEIKI
jgi:hypothetical protein